MYAKKIRIASLIVTHNRVEEAKAQMDIIRELWQPIFGAVDVYHEFNGLKSWYPKKYKEDFLHYHKPMSHYIGASHMLNQGIRHILESGKKYDYIIATSADTWFFEPRKLKEIILACHRKKAQLVTSLWAGMVLSTEFFIISPDLARKIFPLRFTKIINKNRLIKWTYTKISLFESIFTLKVMQVLKNPNRIYLIPGRRIVLTANRFYSPNFYASHHDRNQRKKDLLPQIRTISGNKIENMPSLNKFLS